MEALNTQTAITDNPADLITNNIDIWTSAIQTRSSAGRGSSKKLDLYGIKKLRELILELAIRGKLVPQDASDEPASVLLKKIDVAKSRLINEGKLKKCKPLPEIGKDEKPLALPRGWGLVRLGNAINVINGRAYKKHEMLQEGVPLLRVGNLFTSNEWYYSDLELEPEKYIDNGDLIYSWSASFGPFIWDGGKVIYHYHIWKMDIFDDRSIDKFFMRLFLDAISASIKASGNGIAMIHMTKERMEKLVLPIPPQEEQHRIVAKVDELMALCDQLEQQTEASIDAHATLVETLLATLTHSADAAELEQNWSRIADHFDTLFTTDHSIDQLKQTVLQLAVTGKLTERTATSKKSPSTDVYFPSAWQIQKLDDIAETIVDCPHSTPKWTDSGVICVRTNQILPRKLSLHDTRYVSEETYQERIKRIAPLEDDILYSREGGILGVACRIPANSRLCMGQRMMLIRCSDEVHAEYLEIVLNSPIITEIARKSTTGGAAPRINVSTVKSFPIPIPSARVQRDVVAKVNQLMTLCDRLKARLQHAQKTQLHLADALVEQAVS